MQLSDDFEKGFALSSLPNNAVAEPGYRIPAAELRSWKEVLMLIRFELRGSNVPVSPALREHVERKLDFAVRRFAHRIDRVVVRLTDVNGPKGGPDKRCRIVAHITAGAAIVVAGVDHDAYAAVGHAAIRLDEAMARALGRPRARRGRASVRIPAETGASANAWLGAPAGS